MVMARRHLLPTPTTMMAIPRNYKMDLGQPSTDTTQLSGSDPSQIPLEPIRQRSLMATTATATCSVLPIPFRLLPPVRPGLLLVLHRPEAPLTRTSSTVMTTPTA